MIYKLIRVKYKINFFKIYCFIYFDLGVGWGRSVNYGIVNIGFLFLFLSF